MGFVAGDVWAAAATATVAVDIIIHPIDTLITRIQSPSYKTQYRQLNGSFHRNLFLGLYQGFGPTLIAGIPSSGAFFTVYEGFKSMFSKAQSAGHLPGVPLPVIHALSSAAADLTACAIINPAEVLKQNAQVSRADGLQPGQRSHVLQALRKFSSQPARLWTGYTMLVASSLPGTSLTFCLYEFFKSKLLKENKGASDSIAYQMQVSAVSAAVAAGCASCIFVPVDVVKTRMRLQSGNDGTQEADISTAKKSKPVTGRLGPTQMAKQIIKNEGLAGLFRGLGLTFVASTIGAGLYLGCYEGCKMYMQKGKKDELEEIL